MSENATDNDYLFRASRHRQEAAQQTGESSWLHAPRTGWTAQQEAKSRTLSNSPEGRKVNGVFIVGGSARIQGRL